MTLKEHFKNKKVLVIGDVMIDAYVVGNSHRMSPEAPVPVVEYDKIQYKLGGAANVALNLKALGADVQLLSIIGSDKEGTLCKQLLNEQGLSSKGILKLENRPTTLKTRILSNNQHLLRLDRESTKEINRKEEVAILKLYKKLIAKHLPAAVLFQDYNKGLLSHTLIQDCLEWAHQSNIKTIVDPKFTNFFSYQNTHLLKPNLKEVNAICPFPVEAELKSLNTARDFISQHLKQIFTIITLSDKGVYVSDGKTSHIFPAQAIEVVDVCGAGDAVVAVLALSVINNFSLTDMGQLSNLTGAQICKKSGVARVDLKELASLFEQIKKS